MIDLKKMKTMTDAEIRADGGTVHYCGGKHGVTRITSNVRIKEAFNVRHPDHGTILRMTKEEAELDAACFLKTEN
jgi:hypothetical protein